jgi:hypothetical protein
VKRFVNWQFIFDPGSLPLAPGILEASDRILERQPIRIRESLSWL